ncbi:hypothetical protein BaRGS_00014560, partial [Batillaria attramentaria]
MELLCRDRMGAFNATFFRLWSCSMCYSYLFHESNPAFTSNMPDGHQLVGLPVVPRLGGLVVSPDVDDPDAMSVVCSTLRSAECDRWTRCCKAAEECCREQLMTPYPGTDHSRSRSSREEKVGVRFSPGSAASLLQADPDSEGYQSDGHGATFQMGTLHGGGTGGPQPSPRYCPRTWDGFGCFRDTPAGQTASIYCPAYIDQSDPH